MYKKTHKKTYYYLFADATWFDALYATVFHQLVCDVQLVCVCDS